MSKTMGSLQDLIEEAKLRTVWWILCIFAVTYFLTNTSKSMLMNIPIAVLIVSGLRVLLNDVEFRWKVRNLGSSSYLSFLEKKQLSVNDSHFCTLPPPQKWKRNIDSPVVEAAIEDFIAKILQDFVVDLWYSDITPDKEAPELIHGIIMDVLGEVSGRLKAVNLVDLLTKDVVDLIGDHLDMFRRNQAAIGVDVMKTLSSEERDERLKHHLFASTELHPALISAECEYKVLQRLMGGLLAVVLRRKEAKCSLVRCIARELLTCLVMQPIMNFASPLYINELIECIILAYHNDEFKDVATDQSPDVKVHNKDQSYENLRKKKSSGNQENDSSFSQFDHKKDDVSGEHRSGAMHDGSVHTQPADWAKKFEAATQRREEVLMPENLENMWGLGRNYKKKIPKRAVPGLPASKSTRSVHNTPPKKRLAIETPPALQVETSVGAEDEAPVPLSRGAQQDSWPTTFSIDPLSSSKNKSEKVSVKGVSSVHEIDKTATAISISDGNRNKLKRSSSTSDLKVQSNLDDICTIKGSASIINEYYSADSKKLNASNLKSSSDVVVRTEGLHVPKLRSRVIGAYFEKIGSNSFAVYSIAVTDASNDTWFVKRRYSNFERLHRHLKAIPNYTLHLPPKRIFSSSTEDAFVHQRCIQLDKYLQDLLSIANVAEQHEVWDFLSDSSKKYSFGKSASAMRTLAVNVDDAMDDIVRQFKGVSGGLMQAVVGPSSSYAPDFSITGRNYSWHGDDINKLVTRQSTSESINSFSTEDGDRDANGLEEVASAAQADRWLSDDELEPKSVVLRHGENVDLDTEESHNLRTKSESSSRYPDSSLPITSTSQEDPAGVPSEWTPPNLSVPVLNLVDNIFQLKRRGWLRRQVFWISKQILQLVMEDAIDDWLVRQIQWLRREDVIAQGIRWVKDILWPDGTFFLRLRIQDQLDAFQGNERSQRTTTRKGTQSGSFKKQLEAARQASDVKKMIFDGAPTTLVSLIGHKQYRRCARDIYYFLQSAVCLKQLGYGILELVMISVFPELRDLVTDIHEKMHVQPEL